MTTTVNKVQNSAGTVWLDISSDTVTAATLSSGVTAHDKDGNAITGTLVPATDKLYEYLANTLTSIDYSVRNIKSYGLYSASNLQTANLPNATSLGQYAFYNCNSLMSVNIPSCRTINKYAFAGCSSLTTITLGAGVLEHIYEGLFENCSSLQNVSMKSVTELPSKGFAGCSSLTRATFGNALQYVSANNGAPFAGCTALEELVIDANYPPTMNSPYLFEDNVVGVPSTFTNFRGVFVRSGAVELFKNDTNWSAYSSFIYPISEL